VDRCISRESSEGELFDDSFLRENLLSGGRGPAQEDKVVEKSLRQETLLPILGNRRGTVSFAQGGSIVAKDKWMMAKLGEMPSQSPIDKNLAGGVGEMIISTNHMGDAHQMVIYHTGKIIGSHSIGADDDEIANSFGIEMHFPVNEILKNDRLSFHSEAEDRAVSFGFHPGDLIFGKGTATTVITGHLSFGKLFLPDSLQPFRGAEAFVDFSFLKKLIRIVTIERKALGLAIGAIGSALVGTFVPKDSQPMKIFNDSIKGGLR
jgi:hypothetical protein